jgi:hypothetical protein
VPAYIQLESTAMVKVVSLLGPVMLACLVAFSASPVLSKTMDEEACTTETRDAVGRFLRIENFVAQSKDGVVVSESCKSWPYKDDRLLAAFAYDKGVEYEKSLVVAVLDKKTMRVVSSRQSVIGEDAATAVGERSLKFDTARYQLSKDARAFGLRFHNSARGPSCADGASWDQLTLFVPNGKSLLPVLTMDTQFQNALSGCIGSATGHDVWEYGNRTLSIANTTSNGFSDLRIVEAISMDTNMEKMPDTVTAKKRVNSRVMKFDGKEYK